jgi:hypothetical protein
MQQFFRILMFSPRLTIGVFFMIFGGIGGALSSGGSVEEKKSNPWGKNGSGSTYSAQDRADDGWGNGTRASNGKADRGRVVTKEKVWVNKDGVIFEEEDIKALDRSEYE